MFGSKSGMINVKLSAVEMSDDKTFRTKSEIETSPIKYVRICNPALNAMTTSWDSDKNLQKFLRIFVTAVV